MHVAAYRPKQVKHCASRKSLVLCCWYTCFNKTFFFFFFFLIDLTVCFLRISVLVFVFLSINVCSRCFWTVYLSFNETDAHNCKLLLKQNHTLFHPPLPPTPFCTPSSLSIPLPSNDHPSHHPPHPMFISPSSPPHPFIISPFSAPTLSLSPLSHLSPLSLPPPPHSPLTAQ